MAIRYAGTQDPAATQTLTSFVHYFLKVKVNVGKGMDEEIIENCIASCALSLSVVLAGSGDLSAFKLIRSEFTILSFFLSLNGSMRSLSLPRNNIKKYDNLFQ